MIFVGRRDADRMLASNAPVSLRHPEGIAYVGAALGYAAIDFPHGVEPLALTTADGTEARDPARSLTARTVVVLDSCWGSEAIVDSLAASFQHAAMSATRHEAVAVFDPDPIYYSLLRYGALSANDYLALPYALLRDGSASCAGGDAVACMRSELVDHFETGIDARTPRQTEVSGRQLRTAQRVTAKRITSGL
jgi:hypothetical protein